MYIRLFVISYALDEAYREIYLKINSKVNVKLKKGSYFVYITVAPMQSHCRLCSDRVKRPLRTAGRLANQSARTDRASTALGSRTVHDRCLPPRVKAQVGH